MSPDILPEEITAVIESGVEHLVGAWNQAQYGPHIAVSASQLHVLLTVDDHGSVTVNELAAILATAPSSASRLCDRLQAAGLLARTTPDDDRRKVTVALTGHGRQILQQIHHKRRRELTVMLQRMSSGGRAALLRGLTELSAVSGSGAAAVAPPREHGDD